MPRHLSLSHFAFFRWHLEGLPLATLAQRYLRGGLDETTPKRTLQSVWDTLSALAIDPACLLGSVPTDDGDDAPTLEAFRRVVDPRGFYGEAELMQLLQQQFGQRRPDRRQQRRARCRLRRSSSCRCGCDLNRTRSMRWRCGCRFAWLFTWRRRVSSPSATWPRA